MPMHLFKHNQTAYKAAVRMLAERGKAAVPEHSEVFPGRKCHHCGRQQHSVKNRVKVLQGHSAAVQFGT